VGANGEFLAQYQFDPYGNTIAKTGALADVNPFRFSTKYLDAETGLYYYGYRYYQPETGRWVSRDPALDKAFQETRSLIIGSTAKQTERRRWQQMLVARGHLRRESIKDSEEISLEPHSQNEYAFLANMPVDHIDVLGLQDFCGSVGTEWVPELWFGGPNGACAKHDDCFDTCGYGQEYCNGLFLANMVQSCPIWPPWETATCLAAAAWYYAAVQNLGQTAYCNAQAGCCPKGDPTWGTCP